MCKQNLRKTGSRLAICTKVRSKLGGIRPFEAPLGTTCAGKRFRAQWRGGRQVWCSNRVTLAAAVSLLKQQASQGSKVVQNPPAPVQMEFELVHVVGSDSQCVQAP